MDRDADQNFNCQVFPRVTKCTFHKYGPSGGIQRCDQLSAALSKPFIFVVWSEALDSPVRPPLSSLVPNITDCSSCHRLSVSNIVSFRHDIQCVLPINIINEKIYVFLWFVLILLSFLSPLVLLQVLALHPLGADHPWPQPPLHPGHLQRGPLGHPQQKAQHMSKV